MAPVSRRSKADTLRGAGKGCGLPAFPLRFQYRIGSESGVEIDVWTVVANESGRLTAEIAPQRADVAVARPLPSAGDGGHRIEFTAAGAIMTNYGLSAEQCVAWLRRFYRGVPDDEVENFFRSIHRAASRRD